MFLLFWCFPPSLQSLRQSAFLPLLICKSKAAAAATMGGGGERTEADEAAVAEAVRARASADRRHVHSQGDTPKVARKNQRQKK